MDIRPDYANIEQDGQLEQVDPDEVAIGSDHRGAAGRKGARSTASCWRATSSLNTSALTGESLPRDVHAGDEIISGCINMTGVLKVRTTKEFGESTVSKILELVENASSRKSRSEDFYLPVCQDLYPGGLLRRAGAGGSAAPGPAACWG